jgi:hypothetical protein
MRITLGLALLLGCQTAAGLPLKKAPTKVPTPPVTPTLTASLDQKKFEAVYRAAKTLDIAVKTRDGVTSEKMQKLRGDLQVEIEVGKDSASSDPERSLVQAYTEVGIKAGVLQSAVEAAETTRKLNQMADDAMRRMGVMPKNHSEEERKEAEVYEDRYKAFRSALEKAESIYLGRPSPTEPPVPSPTPNP